MKEANDKTHARTRKLENVRCTECSAPVTVEETIDVRPLCRSCQRDYQRSAG